MNVNPTVKTYSSRQALGADAACDIADTISKLLRSKPMLRMIFAAAPSQTEAIDYLVTRKQTDFSRITAFHMDEYIGLPEDASQGFGNYLRRELFQRATFKQVYYLNGQAPSPERECSRYATLLNQAPIDIVCMGIGENGHIAFNDPPTADFNDPCSVKVVRLDNQCRVQQVHDGCFAVLDNVPTHAYTLTVPMLVSATHIFCIVPGKAKAEAVRNTLQKPVSEAFPASILRRHPNAIIYLDNDSAKLL